MSSLVRRARVLPALALAVTTIVAAGPAYAQGRDDAAAEALFLEGRRLMAEHRYDEACAKLAASQNASPAVGTLLNLGECYERAGKTATAWATFREAIDAARAAGRADREKLARTRADALEPKLARVKLVVTAREADMVIKRDGVALDAAVADVALPVDPGPHKLEVSAPGRETWSSTFEARPGEPVVVEIPALAKSATAAAPAPAPAGADEGSGDTLRLVGYVVAGAGVVGLGLGTWFGLTAQSKWSDAQAHCRGLICDAEGGALAADAKSSGNLSTIAFIAGGLLTAGGVTLVLLAPSRSSTPTGTTLSTTVAAAPGGGHVFLSGALP